jgi:nicotinamide-nucleotide amidase
VAVAESLTSGKLATTLGAGPDASEWFVGGVVAYAADDKNDLLGVTPGPVETGHCPTEMARGVARLLRADATVAVTGVGGPDPDEGEPAGTVYLAAVGPRHESCRRLDLDGNPDEVVLQTVAAALTDLRTAIAGARGTPVPRA